MTVFYFNHGFYDDRFGEIPPEAMAISEEEYLALLTGQAEGKQIGEDGAGNPILIDTAPVSLEEIKAQLLRKISIKTDHLKGEILADYPQAEIESFYRQEQEAHALKANTEVNAPMLREIAQSRGMPLEVLVEKVLEKAEQFAAVVGTVLGKKQKFEDEIAKAETFEQLEVIQEEVEKWFI